MVPTTPSRLEVHALAPDDGHREAAARAATFDDVPGATTAFVDVAGIDVHLAMAGSGPPDVLLLHHFYGNVRTWRHVLAGLSATARAVAFDRPGFGWTERPARADWNGVHPFTRTTATTLALGVLDHLGIDRAVVVGASAGGTLALRLAADHPDRVAGLVLLAPAVGGDVGPPGSLRAVLRTAPARAVGRRIVRRLAGDIDHERVGGSWADPSRVTDADVAAYRGALDAPGWDRGLWDVMTAERPPNLWDRLPTIGAPALVLSGEQDRVVRPRWSRRTADALPRGEFVPLPDCGHTPHEECPDRVVRIIRGFLEGLERR